MLFLAFSPVPNVLVSAFVNVSATHFCTASFWSISEKGEDSAASFEFSYQEDGVMDNGGSPKWYAFSVRCIKDL